MQFTKPFFSLGILLIALAPCAGARESRPNILLIAVDDLRPQLGAYGNERMITPNMDRLAEEGILFERAYNQFAICGPSRASLLSGMYPQNNGIRDSATPFRSKLPDAVTLPQYFRENGYHTVGMGKIFHHVHDTDPVSWDRWVDFQGRGYFSKENIAIQRKRQAELKAREEAGETFTPHQKFVLTIGPATEAAEADETLYPDGQIAKNAVEVLMEIGPDEEPFFLAVGFLKPHLPLIVPKKYWDLYEPDSFAYPATNELPDGAPTCAGHNSYELRAYSDIPNRGPLGEDIWRRVTHGYHAATSFIDAQIGKILDELEARGLAENTIVILWGDHGFHLGEHGLYCKDTNYELSARSPLILRGPTIGPERTDRLVEFVDIFPTLCDLAGLDVPAQCEGRSVFAGPGKKAAFTMNERLWDHKNTGHSMRTDRYRYVRWVDESGETVAEELYDYEQSPAETDNLADDPAYRDVLERLRADFEAWRP